MPATFNREAYEAASSHDPDAPAFVTWEQLAEALDKLASEQRCGTAYADCLLQIRSLLIGRRALVSNELAEQNRVRVRN